MPSGVWGTSGEQSVTAMLWACLLVSVSLAIML